METWVETWPGLCLENSMPASECQCSDVWSWGGPLWVTVLFSEWASTALPGVSAEVGLAVFPCAGFTFPRRPGDSSGGLLGDYFNFSARTFRLVGRQVHLMN